MYTYKLDYTIWDNKNTQRIREDIIQVESPMDYKDILLGLWKRWVILRGDNIVIGDCNIELMGNN